MARDMTLLPRPQIEDYEKVKQGKATEQEAKERMFKLVLYQMRSLTEELNNACGQRRVSSSVQVRTMPLSLPPL